MCIIFLQVLQTPFDPEHPEKGHLLVELNRVMTTPQNPWDIEFSSEDIREIQKYLRLMQPLMNIFQTLNSEQESTIHRVYHSVKVPYLLELSTKFCESFIVINLAGKHPNFQFHNTFSSVKALVGAFNKYIVKFL